MAKKQRRSVSKSNTTAADPAQTSSGMRSRLSSTEFNPDYSDIITDLKRIGVLAGSFFVILIALSFFLR
ncbi:MAG: hypothetical protein CL609_14455 [Anaerolineaceae bacterium]|nr:hypothetical protein [Anaerolineaceae bacterium]